MGLSFKLNTNNMREASSRVLMETLWQADARIQAVDLEEMNEMQRIYGHSDNLQSIETPNRLPCLDPMRWSSASICAPDFDVLKTALKQSVILDGRNLYDPERLTNRGFVYYGIGRGALLVSPS